jgi:bacterioferritin-associated ferredoxin
MQGLMNLDDQICYCYHVPLRKLVNYARRENLSRASQLSNCLGAGTGCGWCIPILKKIFERAAMERDSKTHGSIELPQFTTQEEYAAARQNYLQSKDKHSF